MDETSLAEQARRWAIIAKRRQDSNNQGFAAVDAINDVFLEFASNIDENTAADDREDLYLMVLDMMEQPDMYELEKEFDEAGSENAESIFREAMIVS